MRRCSVFKSNHGFLLIEHLLALAITSILMLTLTQLLPMIDNYQSNLDKVTSQEMSTLTTQLQKEAQRATHFSYRSPTFSVHLKNGSIATYFISNHRLMRQIDGKGGEVALYDCDKLTATIHNDQSATLTLISSGGDIYSIYLSSTLLPLELEELDEE